MEYFQETHRRPKHLSALLTLCVCVCVCSKHPCSFQKGRMCVCVCVRIRQEAGAVGVCCVRDRRDVTGCVTGRLPPPEALPLTCLPAAGDKTHTHTLSLKHHSPSLPCLQLCCSDDRRQKTGDAVLRSGLTRPPCCSLSLPVLIALFLPRLALLRGASRCCRSLRLARHPMMTSQHDVDACRR